MSTAGEDVRKWGEPESFYAAARQVEARGGNPLAVKALRETGDKTRAGTIPEAAMAAVQRKTF